MRSRAECEKVTGGHSNKANNKKSLKKNGGIPNSKKKIIFLIF